MSINKMRDIQTELDRARCEVRRHTARVIELETRIIEIRRELVFNLIKRFFMRVKIGLLDFRYRVFGY